MKNQTKHEWYRYATLHCHCHRHSTHCLCHCCCCCRSDVCNMIKIVLIRFLQTQEGITCTNSTILSRSICHAKKWIDTHTHHTRKSNGYVCLINREKLQFSFSIDFRHLLHFRVPFPTWPCPCCIACQTIWWIRTWPSPKPCTERSVRRNRRECICRFVVAAVVPHLRTSANRPHCHSRAVVDRNDRTSRRCRRERKRINEIISSVFNK